MTERYRLAGAGDWYEDVFKGDLVFVGDPQKARAKVKDLNKEWDEYIQGAAYDHSGVPTYLIEEEA